MPDIKHPFCVHPKFGAKMQRVYKRADSLFLPIGLLVRFVQKRMNRNTESYQNIGDLLTEREYELWLISNCDEIGKILIKGIILVEKNGSSLNECLFSKI